MKEILDSEIFEKLGILKPMRKLAESKNFIHLWVAFCQLGLEYLELFDDYKSLVKKVRKAIELDAESQYPIALPHLWRQKIKFAVGSQKSIPKNKEKKGKSAK